MAAKIRLDATIAVTATLKLFMEPSLIEANVTTTLTLYETVVSSKRAR